MLVLVVTVQLRTCGATAPAAVAAAAASHGDASTDASATDGGMPNEAGASTMEQATGWLPHQDPSRVPGPEPATSDLEASLRGLARSQAQPMTV